MKKKIDIEIDVTASGFGKDGKVFSHDHISKEIRGVKALDKEREELGKVFSGEDFKLE